MRQTAEIDQKKDEIEKAHPHPETGPSVKSILHIHSHTQNKTIPSILPPLPPLVYVLSALEFRHSHASQNVKQ